MSSSSAGIPGCTADGGGGSLERISSISSQAVPPPKGRLPVSMWYITPPSENMSERKSISSPPRICSGDM